MNINKTSENGTITIALDGRLDTSTAPKLMNEIDSLENFDTLVFDLSSLEYISSAGLRAILSAQKKANGMNSKLIIENVNELCKEIFDVTGFTDVLNIRQ